jgi:hypothetical protein
MTQDPAIQVDIYLERLLNEARPLPVVPAQAEVDDGLAEVVRILRTRLVRFHPSFRFEERLAQRLRAEALAPGVGQVIEFPVVDAVGLPDRRGRNLLVGGAIASGVSIASLAGAALMAWRRARTDRQWQRLA